ncbi:MAG TPA: DUF2267 domain-containing protein [Anaerolineae bacterium]|nr:DUF2267 domain-containing protein [Anaerolineae bacterium]HQK15764.1 DUF2267 domain-containing protein [Anaerolineae bacterium]
MDELIKLVSSKAGIQEAQARTAVETVLGFIKEKLPAPIAAQVEAALANEAVIGQAGQLIDKGLSSLGGLLGKKKG